MTPRRIVYVQYSLPAAYPPVLHSARIFSDAGWQVSLLGVGLLGVTTMTAAPHPRIDVRVREACAPGARQKWHYARFVFWAVAFAIRQRADWVYVSDTLASPVGCILRVLARSRVLYHEHDAPSAVHQSWLSRWFMKCRRLLLRRSQVVVVPNDARGQELMHEGLNAQRLHVVWNCPTRDEASVTIPAAKANDEFWVLYHGTIVPARVPMTLIDALSRLPPRVKLRIRGYETLGHLGYTKTLMEHAAQRGVRDRVEICPPVSRDRLLTLVDECHVGLALMPCTSSDENERHMVGASNKIFDYLARGVPALVTDLPEWQRVFVSPGYARACRPDLVESLVQQLGWFEAHPEEARRMGHAGRQRVLEEWNYEHQFMPVEHAVEHALGSSL